MGFWPFGRDPTDIELVSRIITAAARNGYRVRGKLTIHFFEPQRQVDADTAGDRCATLAVALLRESPDHGSLIGAEGKLSAELTARYPADIPRARAVELAALHVVGDPALSDELRRASGTMPAVSLPSVAQPATPAPAPATGQAISSAPPPGAAPVLKPINATSTPTQSWGTPENVPRQTPVGPPPRRRPSSQIRAIQSLLMPPGTSPTAMGQFVAPTVKDSAARLLIGYLRAHDLIGVRGVSVDEGSAEMLATLVPASDSPPGGYEASRSGEIARWQATLGQGAMFALLHQVRTMTVYLAREALARTEVMPALGDAVIEAMCAAAFPEEAGLLAEVARLPSPPVADFVGQLALALTTLTSAEEDPEAIATALSPLVEAVKDDLLTSAMIIKQSSGG